MFIWQPNFGVARAAADAARSASDAEADAARARYRVEALEERLDRLTLVAEALWGLLRERLGIEEEELVERMKAVDLSDGVTDGRFKRPAAPCPSCARMVSARHARCIYCGAAMPRAPITG
jgi:hypothetical protein